VVLLRVQGLDAQGQADLSDPFVLSVRPLSPEASQAASASRVNSRLRMSIAVSLVGHSDRDHFVAVPAINSEVSIQGEHLSCAVNFR